MVGALYAKQACAAYEKNRIGKENEISIRQCIMIGYLTDPGENNSAAAGAKKQS